MYHCFTPVGFGKVVTYQDPLVRHRDADASEAAKYLAVELLNSPRLPDDL
jgi:hypothetical protein